MNKDEFFDLIEDQREKLIEALEGLSDEDLQIPGVMADWSIKDTLSHLIAWETELVRLLWQLGQGEKPTTLHFSNIAVETLNQKIFQETHERSLDRVLDDLPAVRKQTIRRVDAFSENDLSDPKRFPWLGNRPLWDWVVEDSCKHEAEHTDQTLEWRQKNNKAA